MTKSEKMIQMLDLICEKPGELSAKDLAKLCDVSERGIYRYLYTYKQAGVSIKFNGGGYRVVNMHWHYFFEQKKLANAVAELITRGLKQCKNAKLIKQGEEALKLMRTSRT